MRKNRYFVVKVDIGYITGDSKVQLIDAYINNQKAAFAIRKCIDFIVTYPIISLWNYHVFVQSTHYKKMLYRFITVYTSVQVNMNIARIQFKCTDSSISIECNFQSDFYFNSNYSCTLWKREHDLRTIFDSITSVWNHGDCLLLFLLYKVETDVDRNKILIDKHLMCFDNSFFYVILCNYISFKILHLML